MSSKQTVVATLRIARKLAFELLSKGQYKEASKMAHDALYQIPKLGKGMRNPDVAALHLIAATAYYAAKAA
jgi:hypothetical protein